MNSTIIHLMVGPAHRFKPLLGHSWAILGPSKTAKRATPFKPIFCTYFWGGKKKKKKRIVLSYPKQSHSRKKWLYITTNKLIGYPTTLQKSRIVGIQSWYSAAYYNAAFRRKKERFFCLK